MSVKACRSASVSADVKVRAGRRVREREDAVERTALSNTQRPLPQTKARDGESRLRVPKVGSPMSTSSKTSSSLAAGVHTASVHWRGYSS